MALANFKYLLHMENIKPAYNNINLKSLLQFGMMSLIYLMDHTLFQTFGITLNTLLKTMKL